MKVGTFEGHLTFDIAADTAILKDAGQTLQMGHSWIAGWDELTTGKYQFLTCQGPDMAELSKRMDNMIGYLAAKGVPCLRKKIELCVFDTKG